MDLPGQAYIAAGAVIAAAIAGFFSLLNIVISKDQKVSEFRQLWINELRQEIAKYTSTVTFLSVRYASYKKEHPDQRDSARFYETVRETYDQAIHAYTSIVLRINPNEQDEPLKKLNDDFLKTLKSIRASFNDGELSEARKACDELRDCSIPLLKEEWKRVKTGEKGFQRTRKLAIYTLIASLAFGMSTIIYVSSNSIEMPIETSPTVSPQQSEDDANNIIQPTPKNGAADE